MITIIIFIVVIIIVVIGFEVPSKGPSRILYRIAISWLYLSFFVQWSGGLDMRGFKVQRCSGARILLTLGTTVLMNRYSVSLQPGLGFRVFWLMSF